MEEYYRKNLVGVPCELDIPYGGMPLQQVDIWGHENESLHAVVLFHGGYWQSDSRKLFTSLVKPLTNANIVVACVDYEMATTSPISALVEQCADSLKFLRNRWPNKQIVVGGHSAGAHLALSALLRANAKQHNIARIILFSGIYDLRLLPDTYIGKAIGLTVYDAVRNTIETSEVCSFIGAVKFYVGSIESPVFIEESKRIAAWMKQSSHVDVHLSIVCSQDHFSLVGKLGEPSSTICEEIIHFILTT